MSKKRLRKAVHRNRVKRLMREMWRNHRSAFESTLAPDTQCAVCIFVELALGCRTGTGDGQIAGPHDRGRSDNA